MKSFLLDDKGDVVVENGKIQFVSGNDLKRQTCETVIGTNNGEWFLDVDEGINFKVILGKNPNKDEIQSEIQKGLLQVDSSLFITEFDYEVEHRQSNIKFKASNGTETVKGGANYAD